MVYSQDYFQKMAEYLRVNWTSKVQQYQNQGQMTYGVATAMMNTLNQFISQWTQQLCDLQNTGYRCASDIDNQINIWFNGVLRQLTTNGASYYPQTQFGQANVYNPFIQQNNGLALGMGGGYGIPQPPRQMLPSVGMQPVPQTIGFVGTPARDTQTAYSNMYKDAPTAVKPPAPVPPMSEVQAKPETKVITTPVNKIVAPEIYSNPKMQDSKELNIKIPVSAKGYEATFKLSSGKQFKVLSLTLEKPVDNIDPVFLKIKNKYKSYDKIVLRYQTLEIVSAGQLADLQKTFTKIKKLYQTAEDKDPCDSLKQIIEVLDSKPMGVTKLVENIILTEYNEATKGLETSEEVPPVQKLDSLLECEGAGKAYLRTALNLICQTTIYDPASEEISPYLQDIEVEENKTYRDMRKSKEKFTEWVNDKAVIVSHPKMLRYIDVADKYDETGKSALLSGEFDQITYQNDTPPSCDFEYFLFDEDRIESTQETLYIQTGGTLCKCRIARLFVETDVNYCQASVWPNVK